MNFAIFKPKIVKSLLIAIALGGMPFSMAKAQSPAPAPESLSLDGLSEAAKGWISTLFSQSQAVQNAKEQTLGKNLQKTDDSNAMNALSGLQKSQLSDILSLYGLDTLPSTGLSSSQNLGQNPSQSLGQNIGALGNSLATLSPEMRAKIASSELNRNEKAACAANPHCLSAVAKSVAENIGDASWLPSALNFIAAGFAQSGKSDAAAIIAKQNTKSEIKPDQLSQIAAIFSANREGKNTKDLLQAALQNANLIADETTKKQVITKISEALAALASKK